MADEKLATEEKVPRSVGRRFRRGLLFVVPLDALTGWGSFGVYTLEPGEAAVIRRCGEHRATVPEERLNITLRWASSAAGQRGYHEPSARNYPPRKTSGEDTAMSEERSVDAEGRIEHGSEKARRASTEAAERAREASKGAQQWWGRARQRIAKQTSAGVEFGRLKRDQLKCQREIARHERAAGRIVSILHSRLEGPIPLEPELAHELEALAEAHTHLEAVSERLTALRPTDRTS